MIISHKHRFILLHCPKTAGSSVHTSLYRYLGSRDIAIGCWVDALGAGVRPNAQAILDACRPFGLRAFVSSVATGRGLDEAFNSAVKRARHVMFDIEIERVAHMTASEIGAIFPSEWREYSTMCVVRNPYDRIVSDYVWRTRRFKEPPSFSEYLTAMRDGHSIDGALRLPFFSQPFYSINGELVVDYICKYESLASDLGPVLGTIGIDWDGWLPRMKGSGKPMGYREMYGRFEIDVVEGLFGDELARFGYTF